MTQWKRIGDCPPERCQGRCCEHVGIWLAGDGLDMTTEWLEARGFQIIMVGDHTLANLHHSCPHLSEGLCSLHPDMNPPEGAPKRPVLCDIWPSEPSHLANHPYCGFSFVEAEGALT